jgi:hypothetical protein
MPHVFFSSAGASTPFFTPLRLNLVYHGVHNKAEARPLLRSIFDPVFGWKFGAV